jgi:phosphoribosylformylglycinamidine synthase
VVLLGAPVEQRARTLGGSEYLEAVHGLVAGTPQVDLDAESRLHKLVLQANAEGFLLSAHDCSDGGLAVALAESCILGDIGFSGSAEAEGRLDAALFGEGQGRIVVSLVPEEYRQMGGQARLFDLAKELGVPVVRLGKTAEGDAFTFGPLTTTVSAMRHAYEALLR